MYTKRKLFIFHNEKVVQHIEAQPNQSSYIESLVLSNISQDTTNQTNIHDLLQEIKQQLSIKLTNLTIYEEIKSEHQNNSINQDISNSISNILNII